MRLGKIAGGILLGVGGVMVFLGRMPLEGAETEAQAVARPGVYQFRAHFISVLPQKSALWEGDYAQDLLHQPVFLSLPIQMERDLYNIKGPRGRWRYRALAEVLTEGGLEPDAVKLRSPAPEEVEEELGYLDERFRFQVTATLEGQAPLGELMVGYARTEPVAMEWEGEPLDEPEAQVVYDVAIVMRIQEAYGDGYALMHTASGVVGRKEADWGKRPLFETQLNEAFTLGSSPVSVRDFSIDSPGSDRGEVVVPGYLILVTVSPLVRPTEEGANVELEGATAQGKEEQP